MPAKVNPVPLRIPPSTPPNEYSECSIINYIAHRVNRHYNQIGWGGVLLGGGDSCQISLSQASLNRVWDVE